MKKFATVEQIPPRFKISWKYEYLKISWIVKESEKILEEINDFKIFFIEKFVI